MDAVSALLTITLWGGIGYWGGNSIPVWVKDLKRIEHIAGIVVLGLIALGAVFWFFKVNRKLKDK